MSTYLIIFNVLPVDLHITAEHKILVFFFHSILKTKLFRKPGLTTVMAHLK